MAPLYNALVRQQNDHRRACRAAVITKPWTDNALALASLEARIGLVDDVNPPLAPHETVVPMSFQERFQ
jgi:hypothetical protein